MTRETAMTTWAQVTLYGPSHGNIGPADYSSKTCPDGGGRVEESTLLVEMVNDCFAAILVPTDRHQWRQAMLDQYGRGKTKAFPCPWLPEPWRRQFWERVDAVVANRVLAARIAGDRD